MLKISFILSLFFVNGSQGLDVNPGRLICISGMNLSPANKNLLNTSFFSYIILTC